MTAYNIGPYVMIPTESHDKYSAFHVEKIQSIIPIDDMTPENEEELGYKPLCAVMVMDCGEDVSGKVASVISVDSTANIVRAMVNALNSQANAFTNLEGEVRGYR